MSLSTYYSEYGSHLARLHRRRRRRRLAYAPTSNTASHDNHEKINSWVSFCFPYEYGAPLGVRAAGAPLLYILKQWIALKVRSDWLVKLQISIAIYLRATQEKVASRFSSVTSEEIIQINFLWCILSFSLF